MTDIQFYASPGLLVSLIMPLLLWLVLLYIAKRVPPAVRLPGIPAGVGGLLAFLLFCFAVEAALALWQFGRGLGEVLRVSFMDSTFILPAAKTLIPSAAASICAVGVLVLTAIGRSPRALWGAVTLLWAAGPLNGWLESVILGVPFEPGNYFAGISLFTIIVSIYMLVSRRCAFTYGTRSARKIAAQYAAYAKN